MNGTVGATTPSTGAFTTLSASGSFSQSSGSNGANTFTCTSSTGYSSLRAINNAASECEFGIRGSAYSSYGALVASDGYLYRNGNMTLMADGSGTVKIAAGGNTAIGTFSSTGLAVTGSISDTIGDVRIIPQNSKSAAYTLVLSDAGKHLLHPSADTTARTFTIPANSSVAYSIGTAITFVNQNSAGTLTIAITTDTMRLAGAGTTGSRTLAANGIATALKITSTEWIISGTNLT